jgi:hypothetical protein
MADEKPVVSEHLRIAEESYRESELKYRIIQELETALAATFGSFDQRQVSQEENRRRSDSEVANWFGTVSCRVAVGTRWFLARPPRRVCPTSAATATAASLAAVGQCLDRQSAEARLRLHADREMQGGIEELADKCTEGRLTSEERDEYEALIRVVDFPRL